MRFPVAIAIGLVIAVSACGDENTTDESVDALEVETAPPDSSPWPAPLTRDLQSWTVRILDRLPHDPASFTQGLELTDLGLIESTGRTGQSALLLIDRQSGAALLERPLDDQHFGEGVTQSGDEIIQLTWQAGIALRYDAATLELRSTATYSGEGWGICSGEAGLWMSNGTSELTRRDPVTFSPEETVTVQLDGVPLEGLNELECIGEHVVANVWKSDDVFVVDPATGIVRATIDAAALSVENEGAGATAVLNGIADMGDGTLLLGGKLWPTFFLVEVVTG